MPPDFRQDPRDNRPPGWRDIEQENAPAGVLNGFLITIVAIIIVLAAIAYFDTRKKAQKTASALPDVQQQGEGELSYPYPAPDRPTAGFSGQERGQ